MNPGTYTFVCELAGFATYQSTGIEVGVQQFHVIDVTMQVAGVQETITVTGETPIIETANASMGTSLDDTEIEVLPQPGRNAFAMAITTPGVSSGGDPQWQRQQDQSSSSLLSLGGGPLRGNNYTLDGVSITDMSNKAVIIPNMNAVEEVKIQVSTYDAEMGRTGGGVFNTIHKSGSNNFSGVGLIQSRPEWGRGRYFFEKLQDQPKSEGSYWLYGGAFGGPIIRNKTFFWASMEGYRTTTGRSGTIRCPSQAAAFGDFSGTGR
ncbi:MAG: carboxypeptidase regulatory-like domain-containing protein, partial [bacterium]|nr:carboxypeptidase regulatory-like domain-containing protein [bacterium]